ncbi:hypothetical protein ACIQ9R_37675 [Streptomyces sp. NPDC094447]|uniref:hypothetical protein n=1 Tax=Streptomyces sp. NPDC094447 TaxID=3366062 RepID=UPI00380EB7C2
MPALTPNQALPYSIPGDPADVPMAMKNLAERIDVVLDDLEQQAQPRHMAQFLGTVNNTLAGTAASGAMTWQLTDFNTSRDGVQAVAPFTDPATTALTVNRGGFWFIYGTVQANTVPTSANIDELGVEILRNGLATPTLCRHGSHDTTITGVSTFLIDASTGLYLDPGDTVGLRALVRRSSGASSATFGRRSITLLRMTTL